MTCASIILGAVIHHFEHMRSRISSTVMLLFWSLMEIVSAIRLRSLIIRGGNVTDPIGFWLFVSQMTIVLLVFILEMIPKPRDYYISLDEDVSVRE